MNIVYLMFGCAICMVAIGILITFANAVRKKDLKTGIILISGGALCALIELLFITP